MKRILLFLFTLALFSGIFVHNANAQISLTATAGTATGTFATLKGAFEAINFGTHKGAIVITVTANTTETVAAVLNASGSGAASYTSINVYPNKAGLSISGNLATPLINLNGADNVTIDGRVNATGSTKSLIITNTNSSTTAGTSTIQFINGATSNTVKYCTIKGSTLSTASGVLTFSTTTSTGNNNNIIDNNNITNSTDLNRPYSVIYSLGMTGAGKDNTGITISNNNIYDFFNRNSTTSSMGIYLSKFTSLWIISGNSFYETKLIAPTANTGYYVMYLATSGTGSTTSSFQVTNNYIGGSSPNCGGTWTKTAEFDNQFYGIYLYTGNSNVSSIQGNTIKNFSYSNASGANWNGIYVYSGAVNIGTLSPNIIGEATGNGSITFTAAGASAATFYAINIASAEGFTSDIQNNIIGSITVANANTNTATNFNGIYNASSGSRIISNNSIGSIDEGTTNSIYASSTSSGFSQSVYGINSGNNGGALTTISGNTISKMTNGGGNYTGIVNGIFSSAAVNIISNNTVRDLTTSKNNTSITYQSSLGGIVLYPTSISAQTITDNKIFNLFNTNPSSVSVMGIFFEGSTAGSNGKVSGNIINNLAVTDASSTNANLYGIKINSGTTNYFNNLINLGGNTTTNVYGIFESGSAGANNLYFNTVNIDGSLTSGTNNSYALYSEYAINTRNFRNNILSNSRSNTGGIGLHYAVYLNYGVNTNLTIDNNDYSAPGIGGVLGHYNSADVLNLVDWKTATSKDANSISVDPLFTSATNLLPLNTALIAGTPISGITTDFVGSLRNITIPTIGAYEVAPPVTYTISGNTGVTGVILSWTDGSLKTTTSGIGGVYSITVSNNWTGTVTPTLAGYTFSPANIVYTNVLTDQLSQNYTALPITYTISGNAGIAGATLSWMDGTAKTAIADGSGAYTFIVSYNWTGTVTPSLIGYTFSPINLGYTNVIADQLSQNYTATPITYTISGNAGNAGVTLSWMDGTAKTATSDGTGAYTFIVSNNWTGTVTPSLTGYTFSPANIVYKSVLTDQTAQDYVATPFMVVNIKVFLEGPYAGAGLMNTTLKANALIPTSQPYSGLPWSYAGTESVATEASIPADVVDWVLVELRDAASAAEALPATKLIGWPKAFFLKSDGSIVDLDGTSMPNIGNPTITNKLYVIVRHRNHIDIMSANGLTLTGNTYNYDFSSAITQAYNGSAGYKEIATGIFGMVAGDIDGDGSVFSPDFAIWSTNSGTIGIYNNSDLDFDGNTFSPDFAIWSANSGTTNPITKSANVVMEKNIANSIYSSQVPK